MTKMSHTDAPPPTTSKDKGGRPVGSTNKFSKEARELAAASGLLPHEILLKFARGESMLRSKPEVDPVTNEMRIIKEWVTPTLEQMIQCAKDSAPYYAPKFGTIEFSKDLTDEEFAELAAYYASGDGTKSAGPGDAEEGLASPEGAAPPGDGVPETSKAGRRRLRI
jgi:hypothetical protein